MLLFQMFSQQALSTSLNLVDSQAPDDHALHSAPSSHNMAEGHHESNSGCDAGDCLDMFCQAICHSGVSVTASELLVPGLPFFTLTLRSQSLNSPLGIDLYPETKPPQTSL